MKRHKLSRRKSRKMFTRNAKRVHKKNVRTGGLMAMRGGIRA